MVAIMTQAKKGYSTDQKNRRHIFTTTTTSGNFLQLKQAINKRTKINLTSVHCLFQVIIKIFMIRNVAPNCLEMRH